MKKAFLSHNSADKEYVLRVAKELGYNSGIIDKYHFEEGYDLREQIKNYLKESDLFVLFASKESLKAPWVGYEMNLAEIALLNRDIANVLVLLVDKDLDYSDIPQWLQYSLIKYVETPKIAAGLIKNLMDDNSQNLYIGRGEENEKFDKHYFSSGRDSRNLVFFGLNGIGRRSFAKKIIKQNFNQNLAVEYSIEEPKPLVSLYRDLLIDFFLISEISEFDKYRDSFESSSIEMQADEIVKLLNIFSKHKQVPILVDNGGMLNDSGEYREEIIELMKKVKETENLFVTYIQNRNPRGYANNILYFVSFVPELSTDSTEHLLKQYCNTFYGIGLTKNESIEISKYIAGYPPTVKIAANEISSYGVDYIIDNPSNILRYNSGVFDSYLDNMVEEEDHYLLKLLNNFGNLNLAVIMSLIENPTNSIRRLIDLSIISVNNESKSYYISSPISNTISEKFGILTKRDYRKIVLTLKDKYKVNDKIPDVKTLDVIIFSILRADMSKELIEFQKLILPSDISKTARNAYRNKDWVTAKNLYYQLLQLEEENLSALEFFIRSKIRLKENTDRYIRRLKYLSKEKYLIVVAFKNMKEGKFNDAAKLYEEFRESYYTPAYVYRDLGECYYQLNNLDKVREILNEGLAKTKFKNKFMLDLAAKNAIKQDNFAEAQAYIDYLEKVDNYGSVLHRKASLALKEGKLEAAKQLAEEAVKDPNSRREFYLLLANIYISLGELSQADNILGQTLEKYKNINIESDNGYLNLRCLQYMRNKNINKAKGYLEKIDSPSDFIQFQYYKLMLEDPLLSLPDKIEAEQLIKKLEKKEDMSSIIVVDV